MASLTFASQSGAFGDGEVDVTASRNVFEQDPLVVAATKDGDANNAASQRTTVLPAYGDFDTRTIFNARASSDAAGGATVVMSEG